MRGFVAVADSDNCIGEVINIGSNCEISIVDTAQLIAEIMDVSIKIKAEDQRIRPEKSEVERLRADNSKIKKLTGWEPDYGGKDGFIRGLKETVEWFTNPENIINYKSEIYNI